MNAPNTQHDLRLRHRRRLTTLAATTVAARHADTSSSSSDIALVIQANLFIYFTNVNVTYPRDMVT